MEHFFAEGMPPFENGSMQHLLTVICFSLLIGAVIVWARRSWSEAFKIRFFKFLGWTTFATVVCWTIIEVVLGRWNWGEDLPLVICNFMAFLAPAFTQTRHPRIFDAIYFYIFSVTFQAVLTPDLQEGFLNYVYIKFWVVHFGMLFIGLYAIFVLGMRPRGWKSILWAVLWIGVYALLMYLVNLLLAGYDANYFYMMHKPPMATVLDVLGPWPMYIIFGILLVTPYFALLYVPFAVKDWRMARSSPH